MTTFPTTSTATAEHAAAERRTAARALLNHPVLTTATHPDEMTLVRRHAAALKQMFATVLGYPLVVESSFARLVKTPLPAHAPTRPARRSTGADLTPRAYTYLALVCAGLLAPGTGEQVLVSGLVEQLRADAAAAGVEVDDTLAERRALVTALDLLLAWGVLVETDGTVAAWGERQEEALLSINRSLLPHLLARPLHTCTAPEQVWAEDPDAPEQPRRSLRRLLVENPLTRREDLTDGEADALSRERREITRTLEDNFGLVLEVRLEGALAYDPDEDLTDVEFPGQGTTRQAALLLLDALTDTLNPGAGDEVDVGGRSVPGVCAPWTMVTENLEDLAMRNAKTWRADVGTDVPRLRDEVVALLESVSLAQATPGGLVLHPACFRYRPEPVRTPTRTRAQRRLDPETPPHPVPGAPPREDTGQRDLFGAPTQPTAPPTDLPTDPATNQEQRP
jgi:uncharacterized protein (TIGR02678 family)